MRDLAYTYGCLVPSSEEHRREAEALLQEEQELDEIADWLLKTHGDNSSGTLARTELVLQMVFMRRQTAKLWKKMFPGKNWKKMISRQGEKDGD